MVGFIMDAQKMWDEVLVNADPRVEDWFMMSSFIPSLIICVLYLVIVKVGPTIMADRKPMEIKNVLLVYNLGMVALSTYIFMEFLLSGWAVGYSLHCQPVDFSNSKAAVRMASTCWWFYISKFIELFDTVLGFRYGCHMVGGHVYFWCTAKASVVQNNMQKSCQEVPDVMYTYMILIFFIMRKKFNQVSFLHVFHHGIMPFSWWFGVKFVPGGFGTFHALLNSFIHLMMYTYYGLAALGPQYQKYLWWKKYMTKLQLTQFILCLVHASQLLYMECNYPTLFAYWIALYAGIFLVLFANFYYQAYVSRQSKPQSNGTAQNGVKEKSN